MHRRLLYPIQVLIAAAAILLWSDQEGRDGKGGRTAPDAAAADRSEDPALSPAPPGLISAAGAAEDGSGRREEVDTPALATGGADLVRVEVIDEESGAAVPEAELLVLGPGADRSERVFTAFLAGDPASSLALSGTARLLLTGGDGSIRIARPAGATSLLARHGGRCAIASLSPGGPGPVVLALRPSPPLQVRVLDHDGEAAAGVPVGIRPRGTAVWIREARSDADGLAVFPALRLLLPELPDQGLVVAPRLLLGAAAEAAVAPDALPSRPVELRLPATGTVEVRVLGGSDGGRAADLRHVVLEPGARHVGPPSLAEPERPTVLQTEAPLREDGRAVFRWVGLGQDLAARAVFPDGSSAAGSPFSGPTRAGQRVQTLLELGPRSLVLSGRLVDGDGRPISGAGVEATLEYPALGVARDRSQSLPCDEDGRFRAAWPAPEQGWSPDRLTIRRSHPGEPAPFALTKLPLPPGMVAGEHELGEILLDELPLLVSGRLINPEGGGIAGAILLVEESQEVARPGGAVVVWHTNFDLLARTGADGSFTARGVAAGEQLRLSYRGDGHLPLKQAFEAGQTGLVLQARRHATMHGSLRADDSVPKAMLGVHAVRSDLGDAPPIAAKVLDDGSFAWEGLEAGVYRVRIAAGGAPGPPLFELDGLQVVEGAACRDPRLQGIDLRPLLRSFALELVDEDGAPVPSATLRDLGAPEGKIFWSALRGQARILTRRWPLDLAVEADGFRPEQLRQVSSFRRVELRRGLEVLLQVDPMPALRRGEQLQVSLWRPGDAGFRAAAQGTFDDQGVVRLYLPAPGRYLVRPTLWLRQGRMRGARGPLTAAAAAAGIEVEEAAQPQRFPVSVDPAALEAARAAGG